MKKCFKIIVALSLILSIQSCGSEESEQEPEVIDNCIAAWFSTQSKLIIDTGIAFGLEATKENCNSYRDAIELWINEAENCSIVSQAEIDQAKTDLEQVDCN